MKMLTVTMCRSLMILGALLFICKASIQAQCTPDITPPSITCPPSMCVNVDAGGGGAYVTYDAVFGIDGCPASTVITETFDYTGAVQTFVVPAGVNLVTITALGAQGGSMHDPLLNLPDKAGALGGRSAGFLSVTPGEILSIYVGGQGETCPPPCNSPNSNGGFNGGGSGSRQGGGGGATDLRQGGTALTDRVIVAAGGGGSSGPALGGDPGCGGGLAGGASTYIANPGGGGTQTAGGSSPSGLYDGAFGVGGTLLPTFGSNFAGGGGGYYGGGAGNHGGGGSGYIGGVAAGTTINCNNSGNGQLFIVYSTVVDNPPATINQTGGLASGAFYPIGTTTNSFSATDAAGNVFNCSFSVTVNDISSAFSCPANMTVNTDPGVCGAVVTYTPPSDVVSCCTTDRTTDWTMQPAGFDQLFLTPTGISLSNGQLFGAVTAHYLATCNGTLTFDYVASGGATGGVIFPPSTHVFQYRKGNTGPWIIIAEGDDGIDNTGAFVLPGILVGDEVNFMVFGAGLVTGASASLTNFSYQFSSSPLAPTVLISGQGSGGNFSVAGSPHTEVWGAETSPGVYSSTCSFTVTVNDNEPPVITCPADITVNNDPGQCGAIIADLGTPVFSDNCSGVTFSNNLSIGGPEGAFIDAFVTAGSGGLDFPTGTIFGPDGNLYVNSLATDAVLRYNGATGAFMDAFVSTGSGGLSLPVSLVFGPDGNLYVTSGNTDEVLRYSGATGAFIDAFVSAGSGGLSYPTGLVFGPDGNLYVASVDTDEIIRYSGATGAFIDVFVSSSSGGLGQPPGLVFGPDGNLYVASFDSNEILRYNGATGDFIDVFVAAGIGGLDIPNESVFGPDGNLYVTSVQSNEVLRYDGATGSFIDVFVSNSNFLLNDPYGLVFGPDGNLYVSSLATDAVLRYNGVSGASSFPVGTTLVTLTATDAALNTATCSYNVIVSDTENPTITNTGNGPSCGETFVMQSQMDYIYTLGTQSTGLSNSFDCRSAIIWRTPLFEDNCGIDSVAIKFSAASTPAPDQLPADLNYGPNTNPVPSIPFITPSTYFHGSSAGTATTRVTYEVYDVNGNMETCFFDFEVRDDQAPTIDCSAINPSVFNAPGSCSFTIPGTDFDPTFDDNCSASISNDYNNSSSLAGATFPIGITPMMWTATDGAGNTATCSFEVTVSDNENPVVDCSAIDPNKNSDSGLCGFMMPGTGFDPTFDDNCSASITNDYNNTASLAGATFPVGSTSVTWTATDASDNTTQCSIDILITDAEIPTISNTGNGPSCGETFVMETQMDYVYTVPATSSGVSNSFDCRSAIIWRTPMFEDNCGIDSVAIKFSAASSPAPNQLPSDLNYGPNTTPVPAIPFITPSTYFHGSSAGTATTRVTYEVYDAKGNMETCYFDLEVRDNEAPTIDCSAIDTTQDNDLGACSFTMPGTGFDPSFDDNCSASITNDYNNGISLAGATFPLGSTSVTWTATDAANNTAQCSIDIVITDTEAPVVDCSAVDPSRDNDLGLCNFTMPGTGFDPPFSDNCSATIKNNLNDSSSLGGVTFPVGATTVLWTATDANSNTTQCSIDIVISDSEAPVITDCPSEIEVYGCTTDDILAGDLTSLPYSEDLTSISNEDFAAEGGSFTENCPAAVSVTYQDESIPYPLRVTRTFTLTDGAGNTSSCQQSILISEDVPPVIFCIIPLPVNSEAGSCEAYVTVPEQDIFDNCEILSLVNDRNGTDDASGVYPVGTTVVWWTLTDASLNTARCHTEVRVNDYEGPTIDHPEEVTVSYDPESCGAIVDYPASTSDNCGDASVVCEPASGSFFPVGTTTVICTATDEALVPNVTVSTFEVTVVDTQAPVILGTYGPYDVPYDVLYCGALVDVIPPDADDECEIASIINDYNGTSNGLDEYPAGRTTVVTWTVTDTYGNTTLSTSEVTVAKSNAAKNLRTVCRDNNNTFKFQWDLAEGAQRYLVRVRDTETDSVVFEKRRWSPTADVAGPFAQDLLPPGNYEWRIVSYCKLDDAENLPGWEEYSKRYTGWKPLVLPCSQDDTAIIDPNGGGDSEETFKLQEGMDVLIYPNPNEGTFYLQTDLEEYDLQILDLEGKVTYSQTQIKQGNLEITTRDLAEGVYLLRISNEQSVVTKRLVIRR